MTTHIHHKSKAINDNAPKTGRMFQKLLGFPPKQSSKAVKLQAFKSARIAGVIASELHSVESLDAESLDAETLDAGSLENDLFLAQKYELETYDPQTHEFVPDDNAPMEGSRARRVTAHTLQSHEIHPKLLPVFLMVLGFALTSLATLLYVLIAGKYGELINILIPSIILSGLILVAMRSTLALWASLTILTLWSVIAAIAKYNGLPIPANQWLITLPVILSLQIIAARYSRGSNVMFAALGCAYIWLAIFTLGSDLTALASGCLVFTLGTAHHRLGKAWGDKGTRFSHHHTIIGWVAAMIGLVWAQHYFISLGNIEANTIGIGANQSFYWLLGIILGLIAIFISSLMRMRYDRLSLFGCLHICAGAMILPIIVYKPALLSTIFEPLTSLPAMPYFGFALSAVIMTLALGFGMNGLRRRRYIDTIIAGFAIFLQFAIIMNPKHLSFDMLIVILLTMLLVLSCELIIARRSIITSPIFLNA